MEAPENFSRAQDGARGPLSWISVRGSNKLCTHCHQPIAERDVEWRPSRLRSVDAGDDELRFHQWCFHAWQRGLSNP